ncbi:biotin/lipoyl-binding protein [bacterium]|nr:biotin/lipoyl-binding protein [bacterium]
MNILSKLKNHKYVMAVIVVLVVLISILIGVNKNNENTETEVIDKKVVLIPVSDYQSSKSTISANGTIESLEQAELKSQIMAPVSKINTSIGSSVSKGQVLVVLQNNDLTAQLNQAKAALKAQETRLEEMKKGTRLEELKITENQLDAAKTSLENTTKQQIF